MPNKAKVYHAAVTVLLDLCANDVDDQLALKNTLSYLKKKRLFALGSEATIPKQDLSVSIPEFKKTDEAKNDFNFSHENL